jgi:hypothetical protein
MNSKVTIYQSKKGTNGESGERSQYKMSETTRLTPNDHQERNVVTVSTASDLYIDSMATESDDGSYISSDMLLSKTSEESIIMISQSTKKLVTNNRHSLPANSSTPANSADEDTPTQYSTSFSSRSRDDVLLRARNAIEGRRISREAAKARVRADIDALINGTVNVAVDKAVSKNIRQSVPLDTEAPKENVGRAKSEAILCLSMVKSDSNAKTSRLSNALEYASSSMNDANTYGGLDVTSLKEVKESVDLAAKLMAHDQTGEGDTEKEVKAQRRFLEGNASEKKKQTGVDCHEIVRIKDESLLIENGHKENADERLTKKQVMADKLKQQRLALIAAKHADIEKRIKQEKNFRTQKRQKEHEAQQSSFADAERSAFVEARDFEEDRLAVAEAHLVSPRPAAQGYFGIGQIKCEIDQARNETDKELAYIGSRGDHTAVNLKSLAESDGAAPFGQVDRILFQGGINGFNPSPLPFPNQKQKDVFLEDEFHEGDSKSRNSEAGGDSSSGSESGSGSSYDIESDPGKTTEEAASYDLGSDFSPGPMWKKAAEEAALAANLAKDLLPRGVLNAAFYQTRSFQKDEGTPTTTVGRSEDLYHQYSSKEEVDEMIEAEVFNEWKGFKRGRMSFMCKCF